LGSEPGVGLVTLDFSKLGSVPPVQALGVVVRCLERVLPLVAWHREFGPLAREALGAGVRCCRGERLHPSSSARDAWTRLATLLRDSLGADSVDAALRAGTGQSVLVALAVLDAVASVAEGRPWAGYAVAAQDASAAIFDGSPFALRVRDQKRLTAAVVRDVQSLTGPAAPGEAAPATPDVLAALGPLWVDEPAHVSRLTEADRGAARHPLTGTEQSASVGGMPGTEAEPAATRAADSETYSELRVPEPPGGAESPLAANATTHAPVVSEPTAEPLYLVLDVTTLRARLKAVAEACQLTQQQIGTALGEADEKAAVNAAWYLLNKSTKPPFQDVIRFCNLAQIRVEDLLECEPKNN
jgi:hypothetical protein